MRVRLCVMVAAGLGAVTSLLLANDLYHRITAANATHPGADTVFGMGHVLGMAGTGILFLAISLLLIAEKRSEAAAQAAETGALADIAVSVDSSPASAIAKPPLPVTQPPQTPPLPPILPRPSGHHSPPPPPPPKPSFRSARNIYVVEAAPAPEPSPESEASDEIGTPLEITASEFQRAVVYEQVVREQGEVPIATPIASESNAVDLKAVVDVNPPVTKNPLNPPTAQ